MALSGSLLLVLTNEKLNACAKEVANFTDIKKNLTFHTTSDTFASTITLSNRMPIETVSEILKHSKITTTQIYAGVMEHEIKSDMDAVQR